MKKNKNTYETVTETVTQYAIRSTQYATRKTETFLPSKKRKRNKNCEKRERNLNNFNSQISSTNCND